MTLHRTTLFAAVIVCLAGAQAFAQDAARVAVCNPARVFSEMQESKDLQQKMDNDVKTFKQENTTRQNHVKDLQSARDLLKPDSAQYQQADKSFMQAAIEYDTWSKLSQAQLQGQLKQQMKELYDKIVSATQAVAQQKNIDLVVAEQPGDLPDNLGQIPVDQLKATLLSRNTLYVAPKMDISKDVVAYLDAKYKGAPPASAPLSPPPAK